MLTQVRKTIKKYSMIRKEDRILVGVSGGADSVVLLAILNRLRPVYGITLAAAHFNHRTRATESDRDELFVRDLCESLGILLLTDSLKKSKGAQGMSVEDFLRRQRYAFFEKARRKAGANRVALGHNRDDQAETVLMNLIRGTGLSGLSGIPPVRDDGVYIRPLIDCSRLEITGYLKKEGLSCVEDSSNADERFRRNRIRHSLMPELERGFNPAIRDTICRLADVLRQENDYITEEVCRQRPRWRNGPDNENAYTVPIGDLRGLHPALRRRVVLEIARDVCAPDCAIGFEHVQAVLDLAGGKNPGGSLDLPGGLLIKRNYGRLEFRRTDRTGETRRFRSGPSRAGVEFCLEVPVPGIVRIASLDLRIRFRQLRRVPANVADERRAYMDCDRVAFPLVIRNVMPGDRIQPLGMKGTRKLKSIFIDDKIPRELRERLPVLADEISVLWVPGVRLSERVRVGRGTKRVLSAEII